MLANGPAPKDDLLPSAGTDAWTNTQPATRQTSNMAMEFSPILHPIIDNWGMLNGKLSMP